MRMDKRGGDGGCCFFGPESYEYDGGHVCGSDKS